jgi:glycosyltransferase involved in cell wall biosynthesis
MNRIALIEFGGSHDECLLTQMEAVHAAGWEIVFVTNQAIWERNPHLHRFCKSVYYVEPKGKAIGDFLLMRRLVKFLKREGVSKLVFNTAQGGHIRNLALLIPKRMECYGIIHTVRKFQGSATQKVIHRRIKDYVVLSDDLLKRIQPPEGIAVGSFYPVSFPQFDATVDKPAGQRWIGITGGVENRRKDLDAAIAFIRNSPENVHFVFIGKTDVHHPDAQTFLQKLTEYGLEERVRWFNDFVPQETFDALLKQCDFLLPLIHPGTPSADQYINNQISGAFTVAFGYTIPLLIHAFYRTEEDLQLSAHFYSEATFAEELAVAFADHEKLKNRIAANEKWTKEYQYGNFRRFVGIP